MSSLRSIFEKKSSTSSGPATSSTIFPLRPIARPKTAQDDAQKDTRASLDIPQTDSQWSLSGAVSVPRGLGTAGPPVPRPRQRGTKILQRPVSTASLSAPCSPPLLTVNPPSSPPQSRGPASVQSASQAAFEKPFEHAGTGLQSPRIAPVPPKRVQPHVTASSPSPSMADSRNENAETQPTLRTLDHDLVDNTTRSLPQPANRAHRPKVPAKPIVMVGKAKLEPFVPAAGERVSPFSTPPSSDESTEPESDKFDRRRASRIGFRGIEGRQITPESTFQPPRVIQRPGDRVVVQKYQGADARRLGFTHDRSTAHTLADHPPGLPPRGPHEQRRSVQGFDALIGKAADVAMPFPAKLEPRNSTRQMQHAFTSPPDMLPPPKRASTLKTSDVTLPGKFRPSHAVDHGKNVTSYPTSGLPERRESENTGYALPASDYPDIANLNRRHPYLKGGIREIDINYDTRLIETCGRYVCTTGHLTRAWDSTTGDVVLSLGHWEKEIRVTALAFKPGVNAREEGYCLWLGNNCGDIQEVDIAKQSIVYTKSGAHDRREIVKIYRHQSSMWTLDDGGKLCVWLGDETGLPDLQRNPLSYKVPKGHTFSIIIQEHLWIATGKDISIFRPNASESAAFPVTERPLTQPRVGIVTSGAVIGGQFDRVYFGHADGKVTIYSTVHFNCLGVVSVSVYKINSLAGAGFHLWAGYNTGMLHVYDTRTRPWSTRKIWPAHDGPILDILVDRSSLWNDAVLRVVSLGADNAVRFWDGTLEDDWLSRQSATSFDAKMYANLIADNDMQDHDIDYCSFREISALVVTWNAGASTPAHFRYEENRPQFFHEVLQAGEPPDLLIFGFQELVDLEDKKLTASEYGPYCATVQSNSFQRLCLRRTGRRILPSRNT